MLEPREINGNAAASGETFSRKDHTRELNALTPNISYSRKRVLDIAAHYAYEVPFAESSDNTELSFALKSAAERFNVSDDVINLAAKNITLGPIGW